VPDTATTQLPTARERYINGLRALASVMEEHPEVPLPYDGYDKPVVFYFLSGADPRAEVAAAARAFPCSWRKSVRDDGDGPGVFHLTGELDALKVELTAYRNDVCTRIVTGTREITETVKDPAALAEVPEIEVTRVVEDVTWDCGSLLAPRIPVAAALDA